MNLEKARELALKCLGMELEEVVERSDERVRTLKNCVDDFMEDLKRPPTELELYLETCDNYEILLLQTLMLIGRDERKPEGMSEQEFFDFMVEAVKIDYPNFDKDLGIEYMTGKKDLKQYWKDGLRKLSQIEE